MLQEGESRNQRPPLSGFLTLGSARDLSITALVVVIAIKFAVADFNIDLKDFSFTDFLSLILAISSVALSAAFYFKADESARSFYTHTYKFTKDVSEMLGRIDSGFGEKLRSIDQGYIGLSQKFDNFKFSPAMTSSVSDQTETQKAAIEEQEAARDNIIEDLMRRADVAGAEKEELLAKLNNLTEELARSRADLEQHKAANAINASMVDDWFGDRMTSLVHRYYDKYSSKRLSPDYIRTLFNDVLLDDEFNQSDYDYMQTKGLLQGTILTSKGVGFVRGLLGR